MCYGFGGGCLLLNRLLLNCLLLRRLLLRCLISLLLRHLISLLLRLLLLRRLLDGLLLNRLPANRCLGLRSQRRLLRRPFAKVKIVLFLGSPYSGSLLGLGLAQAQGVQGLGAVEQPGHVAKLPTQLFVFKYQVKHRLDHGVHRFLSRVGDRFSKVPGRELGCDLLGELVAGKQLGHLAQGFAVLGSGDPGIQGPLDG